MKPTGRGTQLRTAPETFGTATLFNEIVFFFSSLFNEIVDCIKETDHLSRFVVDNQPHHFPYIYAHIHEMG